MINGILNGLKSYRHSLSLISKLGLWSFFLIPILISFLTASLIAILVWQFSDNMGHWIEQIWPWETGKHAFFIIAEIVSGLFIIAIGLILYKHIIMALSAPFMSPVSEKIERHLLGETHEHRDTSFKEQLWRGIRINTRNLSVELLITLPILLLNFIPIIGNFFSAVLLFLTQSYYAGFGNMDYTLERHLDYSRSVQFVRKNRGQAIGNGMIFMLFLLIPVLGVILVLPLSVTAATRQTVHLLTTKEKVATP